MKKSILSSLYRCKNCGFYDHRDMNWPDYHCPACGALNEALYKSEHLDPKTAKTMDKTEIEGEYVRAEMPFVQLPKPRKKYARRKR